MTATRSSTRSAALLLALVMGPLLGLAGCSSDGDGEQGTVEDGRASAAGVSFEIPDGWEAVDAADIAAGAAENDAVADLAEGMNLEPAQLEQAIAGVDLYVFSDQGPVNGFLDNINVTSPGGDVPGADQLSAELRSLGATVGATDVVETDLGNAVTVTYQLPVGTTTIHGYAVVVDADGAVSVTVSAGDAALTQEAADRILESLREAD